MWMMALLPIPSHPISGLTNSRTHACTLFKDVVGVATHIDPTPKVPLSDELDKVCVCVCVCVCEGSLHHSNEFYIDKTPEISIFWSMIIVNDCIGLFHYVLIILHLRFYCNIYLRLKNAHFPNGRDVMSPRAHV